MSDRAINLRPHEIHSAFSGRLALVARPIRAVVPPPPAIDDIHPRHEAKHAAPYLDSYCGDRKTSANPRGKSRRWCWWTRDDRQCLPTFDVGFVPGDRLWVREPHYVWSAGYLDGSERRVSYRAEEADASCSWIPSGHMPRWASRMSLVVEDVRLLRLQDVDQATACAAGIIWTGRFWTAPVEPRQAGRVAGESAEAAFRFLWAMNFGDSPWADNPWLTALIVRPILENIAKVA